MPTRCARLAIVTLACVVSCRDAKQQRPEPGARGGSATERSSAKERTGSATELWPEAPAVTQTSGTRTFAYTPANVTGYRLEAMGKSRPGADVALTYTMTLDLAFKAGSKPNERAAHVTFLDLDLNAQPMSMKMRLEDGVLTSQEGSEEPIRLRRGDDGPIDVGALTDKPVSTLAFDARNRVTLRTVADHPFTQLGAGDMLDSGLILFPDLPTEPVAPGHRWTMTRDTPFGGAPGAKVEVTYNLAYEGDGACPSGAPACALVTFTAGSSQFHDTEDGLDISGTYSFAGKIYFDTRLGTIDESRVRMDLDVKAGTLNMPITGDYILRPRR